MSGILSQEIKFLPGVGPRKALILNQELKVFTLADLIYCFPYKYVDRTKFYLIKEFQRLKEEESSNKKLEWNLQRTLAKINYKIHTDSIKENLIPKLLSKSQISFVYASEGDLLNVALFGKTAKEWRNQNPDLKGKELSR